MAKENIIEVQNLKTYFHTPEGIVKSVDLSLFCHYSSFLRSGYRAGTQHIVGRIELEFIS